jgi:hypothetical protein
MATDAFGGKAEALSLKEVTMMASCLDFVTLSKRKNKNKLD